MVIACLSLDHNSYVVGNIVCPMLIAIYCKLPMISTCRHCGSPRVVRFCAQCGRELARKTNSVLHLGRRL